MKGALTLFLVIAIAMGIQAVEDEDEKLCIKERRRALVSIKKNMDACRDAMVTTNKEGGEIQPADGCLVKCILNKLKALETDGKVTPVSFENALESRATGKRRESIMKTFTDCQEKHAENINTEDTETCPGYAAFGACLQQGIEAICEESSPAESKDEL